MKVFCIGLNKTGTRSLHEALELLGFSSLHWGGPEVRIKVERARDEGRPLLSDIEDVDAYSDILALSTSFELLDQQYPGSKFILTVRDVDSWVASRTRHVQTNIERHERGEYTGTFLDVEPDAWRAEMAAHHAGVRAYFEGRPDDLLVLDITAGHGWDVLCPFLDRPVPSAPFPARS
jgi:hypothetical protein